MGQPGAKKRQHTVAGKVLAIELQTYRRHRKRLLAEAKGRYVLVKGRQIVNIFKTGIEAVDEGYRRFGLVPFLVKRVTRVERPVFIGALQQTGKHDGWDES